MTPALTVRQNFFNITHRNRSKELLGTCSWGVNSWDDPFKFPNKKINTSVPEACLLTMAVACTFLVKSTWRASKHESSCRTQAKSFWMMPSSSIVFCPWSHPSGLWTSWRNFN
jgi:hypothetical protein